MEKLTLEYLKRYGACEEGVKFAERNKLIGFPLDRLYEVEGDFDCFVRWLKEDKPEIIFDDKGNKIKKVNPTGGVSTWEYDDKGNMVKYVTPNGDVSTWEYDDNGNMVKKVTPFGYVYTWEYDDNGNKIKYVTPNGSVSTYEYDDKGNMLKEVTPWGVFTWSYTYHKTGSLATVSKNGEVTLSIPEFK